MITIRGSVILRTLGWGWGGEKQTNKQENEKGWSIQSI